VLYTFLYHKKVAANMFGNMVKAVVDVDRELIAVDAELHSDLEALLLDDGSKQRSLWGINLYPEMQGAGIFFAIRLRSAEKQIKNKSLACAFIIN